jgi:hypothetical protein
MMALQTSAFRMSGARSPRSEARTDSRDGLPNYAERHRYGEAVSTAFVESIVNQVIAKRFAKKQQMQWTPRDAHLLLQLCARVLGGTLEYNFKRWRNEHGLGQRKTTTLG